MRSCYRFAVVTLVGVAGAHSSVRAAEVVASRRGRLAASVAGGRRPRCPRWWCAGAPRISWGTATSASQGAVGGADLADLPVLRRGELLEEAVPGMVVTQHSGDGKANQYFLRGFNLDHGTDFAFSVDGVPVNLPSHAHGQGYSDLNFLIPELVDAIDFEKGPFYAEVGDFSGAGAANIRQVSALPEGIANVQLGQFGYARALLADSPAVGPGTLLYALEYNHYDGPWDLPERSNRYNALLRYHWDRGRDSFNVTGSVYWAPFWHATDQVAERAVDNGLVGRFGAIDQTDGGSTGRAALAFDWTRNDGGTITRLLLYGFYYRLNLWSDFTYALSCPPDVDTNCDQIEQIDRRFVQGGELKRTWQRVWWGKRVENTVGLQVRNDDIPDSGLNGTSSRQIVQVRVYDQIEEANAGVFAINQIAWTPWLRTQLGLRGDLFAVDVQSDTAANSGTSTAGIVSPKATLVFGPWKKTELYLDVGSGFHSNDARGVTITVDPDDAGAAAAGAAAGADHGGGGRGSHVDRSGAGEHAGALVPAVEFGADVLRRLGRHRGQRPLPQVRRRVGQLLQADPLADALGRPLLQPCPLHRSSAGRRRAVWALHRQLDPRRDFSGRRRRDAAGNLRWRAAPLFQLAAAHRGRQPAPAGIDHRQRARRLSLQPLRGQPGDPEPVRLEEPTTSPITTRPACRRR